MLAINGGDANATLTVSFADLPGVTGPQHARDIWAKADLGVHDGQLQRTLESHDSLFVILTSPTVSTIAAAAAAGSAPPVVTLEGGAPNATCAALQSCAYVKGRGCQCNYPECEKYHDCCPDVQAVCQDATCAVYGCHNKSALCSCTDSCSHEHKCCVDFYQACPRHHHPPGPPPSPPGPVTPVGPCGFEGICPPQQAFGVLLDQWTS